MANQSLIIASPSPLERAKLAHMFKGVVGVEILGFCTNLSETFVLAEAYEPALVVVALSFCKQNEWESMKSLFRALGTAWIIAVPDVDGPIASGTAMSSCDNMILHPEMSAAEVRQKISFAIRGFRDFQPQERVASISQAPSRYEHLVLIGGVYRRCRCAIESAVELSKRLSANCNCAAHGQGIFLTALLSCSIGSASQKFFQHKRGCHFCPAVFVWPREWRDI